jgi:drug/metabolite transporter (DMT)-like permease
MLFRQTLAADTSGAVRGVLWMVLSSMFYALIYVVVRGLAGKFDVNQIVFFRAVLGSTFMLPWLFSVGLSALRTPKIWLYMWRMFFSYIGAVAWMYGIAGMPLADANALMFTMPLFTLVLAAIMLSERPGVHRWSATAVGFAGALIILRPGVIEISFAAVSTLFAAAAFSAALIGSKKLTATENPNAMVFYLYTLMIPCAAAGAYFHWTPPVLDAVAAGARGLHCRGAAVPDAGVSRSACEPCCHHQLCPVAADRPARLVDLWSVHRSFYLDRSCRYLFQHVLCELS